MRYLRLSLVVGIATFITVSLTRADDGVKFVLPFRFAASGIGYSPQTKILTLRPGTERVTASRAILAGLQDLGHGIDANQTRPSGELIPERDYTTDRVPVPQALVGAHNQVAKNSPLPTDRLYQLEHILRYQVGDHELVIRVESRLYWKPALGTWKSYRDAYSSAFFCQRVVDSFKSAIAE